MAVNPIEKLQYFGAAHKPSVDAFDSNAYRDEFRRVIPIVLVQGTRLVEYHQMPWAGVIESIKTIQLVAGGGGGGQNAIDVQIGPLGSTATVFAAAADGNVALDNAAACAAVHPTFPTAIAGLGALQTCSDGQTRPKFNMGDILYAVGNPAAGAMGTVLIEVTIAKEMIVRV